MTDEVQRRKGFRPGHPDWCNFGQGQPETGPLEGAPPRIDTIPIDPRDPEHAPAGGLWELREAVAATSSAAASRRSCSRTPAIRPAS